MAYRVPKKSPLKSSVSEMSLNMFENGIQQMFETWTDRYMKAVWDPIMEPEDSQAHTLNLTQLKGVFYLYASGMTVAIVAFLLELWWFNKRGSRNRVVRY